MERISALRVRQKRRRKKQVRILFQGLVCHTTIDVSGNKQQIAALPTADKHKATLSYRKADLYPSGGSGKKCDDLLGCVDTDLGRGEAARIDIGDVPELTKTSTGTAADASPELLKCPPDASLIKAIFFLPPNGLLSRDYYFDDETMFNNVNHGPMPEIVVYSFKVMAAKVTINLGGGQKVDLQPTAEIRIANACKVPGNHYQFYKNIFKNPGAVTVYDPKKNGNPCTFGSRPPTLPSCAQGQTLDIDCVNSQFP
jgi:hypothetical protein